MALLYIDGFENYGNTANAVVTTGAVTNNWRALLTASMKVQVGRDGSGLAISLEASSQTLIKQLNTTNATLVVGVAIYLTSIGTSAFAPIFLRASNTPGMNLRLNVDGSLSALRNTTVLGTSANTGIITVNTWHYVEFKITTANSGGTYDVVVDGVNELTGNGDTQPGNLAYHDVITLKKGAVSGNIRFDDLYVLDGSGSVNNDLLGPVYVSSIYPDGDDTTDFTPTGGGNHYDQVNSVVFNNATYVETGTVTAKDIYTYGGFAGTSNILGVQVSAVARETDARSMPLKILAKSSGNTVNGGKQPVGTTDWDGVTTVFEEDPDGNSWTQGSINSTAFGVEASS